MASRNSAATNLYGLRPDQLFEIQSAFHQFDADHNGFITASEMRTCFQRLRIGYSDAEIQRVLAAMDINQDGRVSYDEYMAFMVKVYRGEAML